MSLHSYVKQLSDILEFHLKGVHKCVWQEEWKTGHVINVCLLSTRYWDGWVTMKTSLNPHKNPSIFTDEKIEGHVQILYASIKDECLESQPILLHQRHYLNFCLDSSKI